MKTIYVLFTVLLTNAVAYGQYFNKLSQTEDLNDNFKNHASIKTSDGGHIAVGGYYLSINDYDQISVVVKYNALGDTLWTKKLDYPSGTHLAMAYFSDVAESANGDIVLVGHIGPSDLSPAKRGGYASLVRLDPAGNLIWSRKIGYTVASATNLLPSRKPKVEMIGDDAVVLSSINLEMDSIDLNLSRIDAAGNTVWSNDIQYDALFSYYSPSVFFDNSNGNEGVGALTILNNGNIFIAGELIGAIGTDATPRTTLYACIADANGTVLNGAYTDLSAENPSGQPFMRVEDAFEMANGDIIITGYANQLGGATYEGATAITLDSGLNFVEGDNYQTGYSNRWLIHENSDGTRYCLATANVLSLPDAVVLTKTDASGVPSRTTKYGIAAGDVSGLYVDELNNQIFFSAFTKGYINNNRFKTHLAVVDTSGVAPGCWGYSMDVLNDDFSQTWTSFTPSESAGLPISTIVFNESAFAIDVSDVTINYSATIIEAPCSGDQGGVDLSVGGAGSFTYEWSNGTNAEDLTDFAGTYSVLINNGFGCELSDTFAITEPLELEASSIVDNVTCFGFGDGQIDLTVTGGTPGYQFNWTNGATAEDLYGLSGGFYQVEVTDTNGCVDYLSVSVTEPPQLTAVILGYEDASCYGNCDGRLSGFASGGRTPYTYEWNDPMLQTTDTASFLCPGTYLFRVTDDNGCINFVNGYIAEPDELIANVNTTPTTCGDSIGTASAIAIGGTSPYFYSWNGAAFTSQDSTYGLGNGPANVQISDANGCLYNEDFTIDSYTQPVDICVVTVDSAEKNLIVWEKPPDSSLAGIKIYRNVGGTYSLVGYQPYDSISQYVDNDFGVDPNITSYRYKISAIDTCGNESDLSGYHETIHLTASLGVSGEVNLIWDDYEGFAFGQYEIWRDSTGNGDWENIGSVTSSSFTFSDLNVPFSPSIKYAIDVVLPLPCTAEKAINHNSTRSNRGSVQGPIGMDEDQQKGARLFPNPAKSHITIALPDVSAYTTVEVFDIGGRRVLEKSLEGVLNTISLSELNPGVYFFRLSGKYGQADHRIVKY